MSSLAYISYKVGYNFFSFSYYWIYKEGMMPSLAGRKDIEFGRKEGRRGGCGERDRSDQWQKNIHGPTKVGLWLYFEFVENDLLGIIEEHELFPFEKGYSNFLNLFLWGNLSGVVGDIIGMPQHGTRIVPGHAPTWYRSASFVRADIWLRRSPPILSLATPLPITGWSHDDTWTTSVPGRLTTFWVEEACPPSTIWECECLPLVHLEMKGCQIYLCSTFEASCDRICGQVLSRCPLTLEDTNQVQSMGH
jgi:hypothetical protein